MTIFFTFIIGIGCFLFLWLEETESGREWFSDSFIEKWLLRLEKWWWE